MALKAGLRATAPASAARRSAMACRLAVRASAESQQPQQRGAPRQPPLASQLLTAGLAVGLTLAAATAPPPAVAAQFNSLADIVRDTFAFVDSDKNGVITKDELMRTSEAVAEDVEFLVPGDSQLAFAMRLFDLNQDGTLATDELLASIALDGAVADDAVDADVVSVFDKDKDGFVNLREFKSGVPPLGPNGEAAKEYIFGRVDALVDGDSRLDTQEFANALTLMRTAVLGY